ncbi:ethanolamine utilization protein EutN, partial [bacterium]
GPGDVVYFVEARDATLALKHELTPSDATIVGLVEDFE